MLLDIISKQAPHARVYLFGSRATGQHTDRSDIDLAIDADRQLSTLVMGMIRDEVRDCNVPYFIDIVDVHNVDEKLKRTILTQGVVWKE